MDVYLRIRLLLEHVFSSVRMNSRYQALFLSTHQEPRYEASCKCKTNCLRECWCVRQTALLGQDMYANTLAK